MSDLEPRPPDHPAHPDLDVEIETILGVLSGAVRKGAWEPAERTRVYAVMGGAELDFREAVLVEGASELWIFAFWGGVEVIVPDDINVETHGLGILGGFVPVHQQLDDPEAPTLRIAGYAVMGGVEVKVKKPKRWFRS